MALISGYKRAVKNCEIVFSTTGRPVIAWILTQQEKTRNVQSKTEAKQKKRLSLLKR
jgi:hypothetical protein